MPIEEVHDDLIYDVGMADGSDTAWYLSLGFRVLAIEANPDAAAAAHQRFSAAIGAGKLQILNVGIGDKPGVCTFWRNIERPNQSSFDRQLAATSGDVAPVEARCVTFHTILEEHGTPHYLKIDIEGADQLCIAALKPGSVPPYLSVEAFAGDFPGILGALIDLGYKRFKLINQDTHTTNTEIFERETFMRAARWVTRRVPLLGPAVRSLPDWLKPSKTEFEKPSFKVSDTGRFGEQSPGKWLPAAAVLRRGEVILKNESCPWYDLHCAK